MVRQWYPALLVLVVFLPRVQCAGLVWDAPRQTSTGYHIPSRINPPRKENTASEVQYPTDGGYGESTEDAPPKKQNAALFYFSPPQPPMKQNAGLVWDTRRPPAPPAADYNGPSKVNPPTAATASQSQYLTDSGYGEPNEGAPPVKQNAGLVWDTKRPPATGYPAPSRVSPIGKEGNPGAASGTQYPVDGGYGESTEQAPPKKQNAALFYFSPPQPPIKQNAGLVWDTRLPPAPPVTGHSGVGKVSPPKEETPGTTSGAQYPPDGGYGESTEDAPPKKQNAALFYFSPPQPPIKQNAGLVWDTRRPPAPPAAGYNGPSRVSPPAPESQYPTDGGYGEPSEPAPPVKQNAGLVWDAPRKLSDGIPSADSPPTTGSPDEVESPPEGDPGQDESPSEGDPDEDAPPIIQNAGLVWDAKKRCVERNQQWYQCKPCIASCTEWVQRKQPTCDKKCTPGCGCIPGWRIKDQDGPFSGTCVRPTWCEPITITKTVVRYVTKPPGPPSVPKNPCSTTECGTGYSCVAKDGLATCTATTSGHPSIKPTTSKPTTTTPSYTPAATTTTTTTKATTTTASYPATTTTATAYKDTGSRPRPYPPTGQIYLGSYPPQKYGNEEISLSPTSPPLQDAPNGCGANMVMTTCGGCENVCSVSSAKPVPKCSAPIPCKRECKCRPNFVRINNDCRPPHFCQTSYRPKLTVKTKVVEKTKPGTPKPSDPCSYVACQTGATCRVEGAKGVCTSHYNSPTAADSLTEAADEEDTTDYPDDTATDEPTADEEPEDGDSQPQSDAPRCTAQCSNGERCAFVDDDNSCYNPPCPPVATCISSRSRRR